MFESPKRVSNCWKKGIPLGSRSSDVFEGALNGSSESTYGRVDRANLLRAQFLFDRYLKNEIVDFDMGARLLIYVQTQGGSAKRTLCVSSRNTMRSSSSIWTITSCGLPGQEIHRLNSKEYYRVVMARTSADKDIVENSNKVVGWLQMFRSIGDWVLKKMEPAYARHLCQYMPTAGEPISSIADQVVTPPYVIPHPSVRSVDLQPVWGDDPVLLLFSDGMDNVVEGRHVFTPGVRQKTDPLDVLPDPLSMALDPVDDRHAISGKAEGALGHAMEPNWSLELDNMAVDVLGNLYGGTHSDRLEMVMDRVRLTNPESWFHVDDTTIIVARLASD
ncbi:hypothetical protein C8Q77DRAFT_1071730 [Trametes polyzona]|nr:hypothetical protein C8Q77DRAFT_1071730 [Trametes polyzona]